MSWHLHPATALCRRVAEGNLPAGREASEMVDPHQINQLQGGAHTLDPPMETAGSHLIPGENWIAPELTGGTEVIRRNSGNHNRITVRVQFELIRMHPYISGIVCDENRNVSDQLYAMLMAVCLQLR